MIEKVHVVGGEYKLGVILVNPFVPVNVNDKLGYVRMKP